MRTLSTPLIAAAAIVASAFLTLVARALPAPGFRIVDRAGS
jgi:hypothetical protein